MSNEPINIQEEENEPHHFGSHNIYMPQAPVGHLLQYYPWRALYETLPFRQPYPQVLYTDHRADEFFNAMSMSLAGLVPDPNFRMEVSLQYPSEESPEEVSEGYLTVIISDPIVEQRVAELPIAIEPDLWLDMLTTSLIQMIMQTEFADDEQISIALVEDPHSSVDTEQTTAQPEWVQEWHRTQGIVAASLGTGRYRYGFRLIKEARQSNL